MKYINIDDIKPGNATEETAVKYLHDEFAVISIAVDFWNECLEEIEGMKPEDVPECIGPLFSQCEYDCKDANYDFCVYELPFC